eukprot:gnl/Chilomastix_cuspidata/305.p1 GENE.gnl/Chilomastix_cuspidata/305~~gnl/Chilomastix_cuspidata/305.p1  ORF type:complete len:841 (-),score=445.63 gnl/Chilomastix_cuspidata/305:1245-3767(-)
MERGFGSNQAAALLFSFSMPSRTHEPHDTEQAWARLRDAFAEYLAGREGPSFATVYNDIYQLCVFHHKEGFLFHNFVDFVTKFVTEEIIKKMREATDIIGALNEKFFVFKAGVKKISRALVFLQEQHLRQMCPPQTIEGTCFKVFADVLVKEKEIASRVIAGFVDDLNLARATPDAADAPLERLANMQKILRFFETESFRGVFQEALLASTEAHAARFDKNFGGALNPTEDWLLYFADCLEFEVHALDKIGIRGALGARMVARLIEKASANVVEPSEWMKKPEDELTVSRVLAMPEFFVALFASDEEDRFDIAATAFLVLHHLMSTEKQTTLIRDFTWIVLDGVMKEENSCFFAEHSNVPCRSVMIPRLLEERARLLQFVQNGIARAEPTSASSCFSFTDGLDLELVQRALTAEGEDGRFVSSQVSSHHRLQSFSAVIVERFEVFIKSADRVGTELAKYMHFLLSGPLAALAKRVDETPGVQKGAGRVEASNYISAVMSSFSSAMNPLFADHYKGLSAFRLSSFNVTPEDIDLEICAAEFLDKSDIFDVQEAAYRVSTILEDVKKSFAVANTFNTTVAAASGPRSADQAQPIYAPNLIRRNLWMDEMSSFRDIKETPLPAPIGELSKQFERWYVRESPGSSGAEFVHTVRVLPLEGWAKFAWRFGGAKPVTLIVPIVCAHVLMAVEGGRTMGDLVETLQLPPHVVERAVISLVRAKILAQRGPKGGIVADTLIEPVVPESVPSSDVRVPLVSEEEVSAHEAEEKKVESYYHKSATQYFIVQLVKSAKRMKIADLRTAVAEKVSHVASAVMSDEQFKAEIENLIARNQITRDGSDAVKFEA